MKEGIAFLGQSILALIIMFVLSSSINDISAGLDSGQVKDLNTSWTCRIGNEEQYFENSLPEKIENINNDAICIYRYLPSGLKDSDVLFFKKNHQYFTIEVDNEVIYDMPVNEKAIVRSDGTGWVFVDLENKYSGKAMKITFYTNYSSVSGEIPEFRYADKASALTLIIRENMLSVVVGIFILLEGIMLSGYYCLVGNKLRIPKAVLWIGILLLFIAGYTILETDLLQIFIGNTMLWTEIRYVLLFCSIIPIYKSLTEIESVRKDKVFSIINMIWSVLTMIYMVLQILRIIDLREWVTLYAIMLVVYALLSIILIIRAVYKNKSNKEKEDVSSAFCGILLGVGLILDVVRYMIFKTSDVTLVTKITVTIYIVNILGRMLDSSIYAYHDRMKLKGIEQEAMTDKMTQAYNRAAYERDYEELYNRNPQAYGVVMLDLNMLKYFNDTYGHTAGDYYIITCCNIITETFRDDENTVVYRMGGDEFCVVMPTIEYAEFSKYKAVMNAKLNAVNNQFFDGKMGISAGYAKFDPNFDTTFKDVVDRADAEMYDEKKRTKKARS